MKPGSIARKEARNCQRKIREILPQKKRQDTVEEKESNTLIEKLFAKSSQERGHKWLEKINFQ